MLTILYLLACLSLLIVIIRELGKDE